MGELTIETDKRRRQTKSVEARTAASGRSRPARKPTRWSSAAIEIEAQRVGNVLDFRRSAVVLLTGIANQITVTGSNTFQKRHGLTSGEWRLLATIAARPAISGVELAAVAGMDKAAISRLTRRLAERGLIQVGRKRDGRSQQAMTLTTDGVRLHDEAIETAFERERCLLSAFSDEDRSLLIDLLARLAQSAPELLRLVDRAPGANHASRDRGAELADAALERATWVERQLAELLAESGRLRADLARRAGGISGACGARASKEDGR